MARLYPIKKTPTPTTEKGQATISVARVLDRLTIAVPPVAPPSTPSLLARSFSIVRQQQSPLISQSHQHHPHPGSHAVGLGTGTRRRATWWIGLFVICALLYWFAANEDDEYLARTIKHRKQQQPELSTKETLDTDAWLKDVDVKEKVNLQDVCPSGQECRFIVAGRIGEQETKAQLHLYQLGVLASSLGRILVLPNVKNSRLGSCLPHPFSFYYSSDSLERLGIKTVTQQQFNAWLEDRSQGAEDRGEGGGQGGTKEMKAQVVIFDRDDPNNPSEKMVSLLSPPDEGEGEGTDDQPATNPPPSLCVESAFPSLLAPHPKTKKLAFDPHLRPPITFHAPTNYRVPNSVEQKAFVETVFDTMQRLTKDTQVVIVDHNVLRFKFLLPETLKPFSSLPLPRPFEHFPYATRWTTLASQVVRQLSPFVAVHWRTETLPANILAPCGQLLVKKLEEMKTRFPTLKHVFVSTDYPLEGGDKAHSTTYTKLLTPQHHEAMKLFLERLSESDVLNPKKSPVGSKDEMGLGLTTFAMLESAGSVTLPLPLAHGQTLSSIDSAPVGFIDKLVSSQAEVFLAGLSGKGKTVEREMCAKESSFTEQIVGARREGREGLWNLVERWKRGREG
ncbi:hypothetical protein T439DRAFT_382094 [Meredithblackwellia eburnea MCA 4105]